MGSKLTVVGSRASSRQLPMQGSLQALAYNHEMLLVLARMHASGSGLSSEQSKRYLRQHPLRFALKVESGDKLEEAEQGR